MFSVIFEVQPKHDKLDEYLNLAKELKPILVGEITADTHVPQGQRVQEQRFDETEVGEAKVVSITEVTPAEGEKPPFLHNGMAKRLGVPAIGAGDVLDQEIFESICNPGKLLLLVSWQIAAATQGWHPPALIEGVNQVRNRLVRIIRDYGMSERREAPQFYPEVERMALG
jgi:hypothetical protein